MPCLDVLRVGVLNKKAFESTTLSIVKLTPSLFDGTPTHSIVISSICILWMTPLYHSIYTHHYLQDKNVLKGLVDVIYEQWLMWKSILLSFIVTSGLFSAKSSYYFNCSFLTQNNTKPILISICRAIYIYTRILGFWLCNSPNKWWSGPGIREKEWNLMDAIVEKWYKADTWHC